MYILITLAVIIFIIITHSKSKKIKRSESIKFVAPREIIKPTNIINTSETINQDDTSSIEEYTFIPPDNNNLALAAEAGHKAKQAVKDKDYNKAWGLFSEQKSLYMKHSQTMGFSARDTFSLDSTVHENYANILRLEKKHHDAFFNILYWVMASYHHPIKRHEQKLTAYFNRCKFKKITIEDVQSYVDNHGPSLVNALEIKEQVKQWKDNE